MVKKAKQEIEIIEEVNNGKDNNASKKVVLTLFLFLVPALVMAYTQEFFTKFLLFFYLGVLLTNFIRDKSTSE